MIIKSENNINLKGVFKRILCWKIAKDEATEEFKKMQHTECAFCGEELYCAHSKEEDPFCSIECELRYNIENVDVSKVQA